MGTHVAGFGGTQAVVHAVAPGRVEADAIRRIRREQRRRTAIEQSGDIVRFRGVAAQQPVLTKDVEIARSDVGLLRDRRDVVGIDQASPGGIEAMLARKIVEQRAQRVVGRLEPVEQRGQTLLLDGGGAVIFWPAAVGHDFTWAMPLDNHTTSDIVVESIAPHGVAGLEVVGVLASNQGCDVPSIAEGFPPTAVSTVDPNGAVLARSKICALQALIGVRRSDANAPGRIEGLRIRYRFEGAAYEELLPWSLEVKVPGT